MKVDFDEGFLKQAVLEKAAQDYGFNVSEVIFMNKRPKGQKAELSVSVVCDMAGSTATKPAIASVG